jgi:hypothetical protein
VWLAVAAGTAIIIIAAMLAGRGGQALSAPDGDGAPRVAVAQEVFDYGDVAIDTPIETVFRISNVGQGTLRILGTPQVELVEGC